MISAAAQSGLGCHFYALSGTHHRGAKPAVLPYSPGRLLQRQLSGRSSAMAPLAHAATAMADHAAV